MKKILTKDNSITFYNPDFKELLHPESGAFKSINQRYLNHLKLKDNMKVLDIGYGIGYGSEKLALKHYKEKLKIIEKYFERFGGGFVIFVFAITPLPFDVVGIFCGIVGYDLKKFFAATAMGKIIKYCAITYAGFYGIAWISKLFGLG